MPDGCVDLTVTSPPYDNLRTYNGFSFNFEEVAKELYRITKDGGVVVWVVGDATINGSETGTSFRQALFFKDVCGFNLHDTMIYDKGSTGGAKGSIYAYWQGFEYMFVFSKGKPSTINFINDKPNKYCSSKPKVAGRRKINGQTESRTLNGVGPMGRRTNVWHISAGYMVSSPDKIAFQHPATFPEQLAKDHIISWSNPRDLVFDPFSGSGTTAKMALLLGRNYCGVDISEEYCEIARKRIEQAQSQQTLFAEGR